MPAFQRPDGSISDGAWTATPLWEKIDDAIPNDTEEVRSVNDPSNDIFEVSLTNLADPAVSTGHIVRIRMTRAQSGGGQPGTLDVIVGLYQTTTLIASATFSNIALGLATVTFTLTGTEADNITDYDALRVRVDANKSAGARTTWCEVSGIEFETPSAASDHNQREFRIRITDPAINANGGGDWAQLINVDESIDLDTFFRIRFDVEETEGVADGGVTYKLQVSKEGGAYADVAVMLSGGTTPLGETWPPSQQIDNTDVVMIVASATFANDAVTTDLLAAKAGFVSGAGMHDNLSPSVSLLANGHTELEWSLVIPRYYDGVGNRNNATDTFDFRVVESDGTLFTGDTNSGYDEIPRITATLAVGHIGGTFIEQPSRVGPFKDGNGNLYYLSEHSNNTNTLLLHKSTDGGDTWVEATATGRPAVTDPEGCAVAQDGDDLLIITRRGDDAVAFHRYRMSSHASPDTWNQIDIVIDADAGQPPVASESCDIAVARDSDGFIFVCYNGDDATDSVIWYTRSEDGGATWQTRASIQDTGRDYHGCKMVLGPTSDDIYIFVLDQTGADLYFDTIDTLATAVSGTLTTVILNEHGVNNSLADFNPPATYDDGGVEVVWISWIDAGGASSNGELRAVAVRDGTVQTPATVSTLDVDRSNGTSHQPVAALAVEGKKVHAIFNERISEDIWYDTNDDEGGWGSDTEEQDTVTCHYIKAEVFTHSSGNGGDTVLGYVWETGAGGLTGGFTQYDEKFLAAAPAGGPFPPGFRRRQLATVRM